MVKRILVVDDSAFMRKIISEQINQIDDFEVVATAMNGESAIQKMDQFNPDVITLDVEMPGMCGLETVKRIREKSQVPVFMLSSLKGQDTTIQALESGATDFIEKPRNIRERPGEFQNELACRINAVFQEPLKNYTHNKKLMTINNLKDKEIKAIVIGASTGGPRALLEIICQLPTHLAVPVFIAQHMPEGFTTSFAKRLDQCASVPVKEAKHGEIIKPGTVYLAPGNYHMEIVGHEINLTQTAKINGVRPAVDTLFQTAAHAYGKHLLAVILTGMGKDGTVGMTHVKERKGHTLAQDEASCVVYGMPGNAVKAEVVDAIANLGEIASILNEVSKVKK